MTKPIIWKENLSMVCRECGAIDSYEPPFDLNVFIGDLSIFSKKHRSCKVNGKAIA